MQEQSMNGPWAVRYAQGAAKLGVEPIGEGYARAEAFFNEEFVRWKDVIDRAGLKLQP
jgi:hypothetical protein